MHIKLIFIGVTNEEYLKVGMNDYFHRLRKYIPIEIIEIKDIKNAKSLSQQEIKQKEGHELMLHISSNDFVVILDNQAKMYSSLEFSQYLQKKMNIATKQLIFIVGGAYGFSEELYLRANEKLSISPMTFSHQIIRLLFLEQLYRGFSIINHSPYHHE